jgi:hypothetical protein
MTGKRWFHVRRIRRSGGLGFGGSVFYYADKHLVIVYVFLGPWTLIIKVQYVLDKQDLP